MATFTGIRNRISKFTSSSDVIYLLIILIATSIASRQLANSILKSYDRVRSAKKAAEKVNSELYRAKEALQESEKKYRFLFENAPVGIVY